MTVINVALLQLVASGCDQQANLVKGEAFCRQAKSMGVDIVLFPEMWSIGYTLPRVSAPHEQATWLRHAIDSQDHFVRHFQALAQELDMAIALTYLEKSVHALRNAVSLGERVQKTACLSTPNWASGGAPLCQGRCQEIGGPNTTQRQEIGPPHHLEFLGVLSEAKSFISAPPLPG